MSTAEDTTDEAAETFTVTLSGPTNATLGDGTGTGTITDDDGAPSLSVADAAAAEGSDVSFTVTLSAASGKTVTVSYDTSRPGGTTAEAADFTAQTNRTLTIPAGSTTGTIAVPTANDTIDEADETFRLTLSSPTNATLADATATGTITDDDDATLSVNDVSGSEGGTLTFTVTLSVASEDTVGVTWTASAGGVSDTADTGDLAGSLTGTLSFAPGDISKTFTVSTAEDTTDEAAETFTVTLSGPTNATLGDGTGTGTITDDDGAPSLSVADAAAAEGSDVSFTVTLSAASGKTVTVSYDTSRPGGTTAEAADFTAQTNRTLTIPAGSTTGTIAVPTANDTIDEADETFRLTLSSPTNATLADATATGTITDDDDATLSVNDVSGSEGGTLTFTVTLSVASEDTVGVTWTASAGGVSDTADTGDLAGSLTGTLTFSPRGHLEDVHGEHGGGHHGRGRRDVHGDAERPDERDAGRRDRHGHDHRRRRCAVAERCGCGGGRGQRRELHGDAVGGERQDGDGELRHVAAGRHDGGGGRLHGADQPDADDPGGFDHGDDRRADGQRHHRRGRRDVQADAVEPDERDAGRRDGDGHDHRRRRCDAERERRVRERGRHAHLHGDAVGGERGYGGGDVDGDGGGRLGHGGHGGPGGFADGDADVQPPGTSRRRSR